MFKKIKENLFKYFGFKKQKEELTEVYKCEEITGSFIDEVTIDIVEVEEEVSDPEEDIIKRLKYIVDNTKKFRIRKKNIRRLEGL